MKINLSLMCFLSVTAFCSINVYASPQTESKVSFVGVNSAEMIFVQLETSPGEIGCIGNQLLIPADSGIKEKILSIALTAKAANSTIVIKTNGCYTGSPSILKNATDPGYFYIK